MFGIDWNLLYHLACLVDRTVVWFQFNPKKETDTEMLKHLSLSYVLCESPPPPLTTNKEIVFM